MKQIQSVIRLNIPILVMVMAMMVLEPQAALADPPVATSASYQLFRDVEAGAKSVTSTSYKMTCIVGEPSELTQMTSASYELRPGYDLSEIYPEPANHVTDFSVTGNSSDNLSVGWTDSAAGVQAPHSYLILASNIGLDAITDPTDGNPVADDTLLSDGSGAFSVGTGVQTYQWTGLSLNTTYYFKIYPYTHSGGMTDYKTDSTVPSTSGATTAVPNTAPAVSTPISNVSVSEDAANSSIDLWPSFEDAEDADSALIYTVTDNTDASLFSSVTVSGGQNLILDYAANANGDADITVRAADTGGLFVESTFRVSISAVNDTPVFTSGPVTGAVQGSLYTYNIRTGDADGDGMTITAATKPTWMTIFTDNGNGTAVLSGTPGSGDLGGHSVSLNVSDSSGNSSQNFTVTVRIPNDPPTDITLGGSLTIPENMPADTLVGTFSASDTDAGDTHTFYRVSGPGGWLDNDSFIMERNGVRIPPYYEGNTLLTTASFDYESKNTYSVYIRCNDSQGASCFKTFTVTVTDVNEPPTGLALSYRWVDEELPVGTEVGSFTTIGDPDAGETFSYTLIGGEGSDDNGLFGIDGNTLKTVRSFDYETEEKHVFTIRVRTSDKGGLNVEQSFTITLNNLNEPPTDITLDGSDVDENLYPPVVAVGSFSAADINPDDRHTYALTSGEGDADNGLFRIDGNTLYTKIGFDYENKEGKTAYVIRVLTNDGHGGTFAKSFTITLNNVNDAPVISEIENADLRGFGSLSTDPLPFTVTDQDTSAGSLTLTAVSDNTVLLPVGNIAFGGSDEERTVTLTPVPGESGEAVVTVTVSDGDLTATAGFILTVTVEPAPAFDQSSAGFVMRADSDRDNAVSAGDTLSCTAVIPNTGDSDAGGVTFIMPVPEGTVPDAESLSASRGTAVYNSDQNRIEWEGDIPEGTELRITFDVMVDEDAEAGGAVSAQGTVAYDPDGDGENDTEARTDGSGKSPGDNPATVPLGMAPDTDGDSIPDWSEEQHGTDPANPMDATEDADGDGADALTEFLSGTDPNTGDTDGDGVSDGQEVAAGTDPRDGSVSDASDTSDTDTDGIPDWVENRYGTDPHDPADASDDSDGDSLSNLSEFIFGSNPNDGDTDGDSVTDGQEIADGTDPADASVSDPEDVPDSDGDGIPDWVENRYGSDPHDPADASDDSDDDGLSNADEFAAGSNPANPDSDGDGMSDGDEVAAGTSPVGTAIPGDVNADSSVDLEDAILCLKVLAGITDTAEISLAADVNGDGRIGFEELFLILEQLAG